MTLSKTVKNSTRSAAPNISNIRVRRTQNKPIVPMLSQRVAPAGTYASRVAAVTASKIEGTNADAIDVVYELTDSGGKVTLGRVRYEIGGYYYDCLFDALIDAGLPEGSSIVDAVGIMEEIEIEYPRQGSLAKIKSRRPLEEPDVPMQKPVPKMKPVVKHQAPAPAADDGDDDFDDFLEDDEDDEL